jgi:hypothetical protein
MSFPRCIVLLTTLLLLGLSNVGFAAERFHGTVTKTERALRGTWYKIMALSITKVKDISMQLPTAV